VLTYFDSLLKFTVVSADGSFYKATFDPDKPGNECKMVSHKKFIKDVTEEEEDDA